MHILFLTVLQRFNRILASTGDKILVEYDKLQGKSVNIVFVKLMHIAGITFCTLLKLSFERACS